MALVARAASAKISPRLIQRVSIVHSANRQPDVETKRYTMAELYELRRKILKFSRSFPPGPVRNEHRKIATSMRFLSKDRNWLAVHTVGSAEVHGIED
jgi:hypothetical protein